MSRTRPAAFSGLFYPSEADDLRSAVIAALGAGLPTTGSSPHAVVAPHAGFVYSGPVAGTAYGALASRAAEIERVVVLGPSHRVAFEGIAASSHEAFETPLGEVPVDRDVIERLVDLGVVRIIDAAHIAEHSIEVQIPFLQVVLERFSLVPLVVGDARPAEVAAVLESVWDSPETLVVISSDLSHFHDTDTARRLDAETVGKLEALEFVTPDRACGSRPLNGLLEFARRRHARVRALDVRNSSDTAGSPDRVVGYAALRVD